MDEDDLGEGGSVLDIFESNDNKDIGDEFSSPPTKKSPSKRQNSRGYATKQNNRKNKIGTTRKQMAMLKPVQVKASPKQSRFGTPVESRATTASSRGTSREYGFEHEKGNVPPQDIWDIDPSMEILGGDDEDVLSAASQQHKSD